jgi:hypothetical protein
MTSKFYKDYAGEDGTRDGSFIIKYKRDNQEHTIIASGKLFVTKKDIWLRFSLGDLRVPLSDVMSINDYNQ